MKSISVKPLTVGLVIFSEQGYSMRCRSVVARSQVASLIAASEPGRYALVMAIKRRRKRRAPKSTGNLGARKNVSSDH